MKNRINFSKNNWYIDHFLKWWEKEQNKFHCGQFSDKQIAYSAWLAGIDYYIDKLKEESKENDSPKWLKGPKVINNADVNPVEETKQRYGLGVSDATRELIREAVYEDHDDEYIDWRYCG